MQGIVVVGNINQDRIWGCARLPLPGETVPALKMFESEGGKGANQAFASARLGGEVQLFARVGNDHLADRCIDALAATGCDITGIRHIDCQTGVAMVLGDSAGANSRYDVQEMPSDPDGIANADIILVQIETPLDAVICAARSARQSDSAEGRKYRYRRASRSRS